MQRLKSKVTLPFQTLSFGLQLTNPAPADQSQSGAKAASISKAMSRRTTLSELVDLSEIPLPARPIVNALSLPTPPGLRAEQQFSFANDLRAWLRTRDNPFCFSSYPTTDVRWNLVAFEGARHYLHLDSDGFGTWIEVKHGLKLWVLARPKDASVASFDEINGLLGTFNESEGKSPNSEKWIIEAIVLAPGTRM